MSVAPLAAAADRFKACVGQRGPLIKGVVGRRDIERFARVSGEDDPRYYSEDAATKHGLDGIPAPPLMLSAVIDWGAGPPLQDLRVDGTGVDRERWLPLENLRLMGGGQDLEFHQEVLAGETFTAESTLEGVTLKEGSSGGLIILVIRTEFRSEGGRLLVTCRETLLARQEP